MHAFRTKNVKNRAHNHNCIPPFPNVYQAHFSTMEMDADLLFAELVAEGAALGLPAATELLSESAAASASAAAGATGGGASGGDFCEEVASGPVASERAERPLKRRKDSVHSHATVRGWVFDEEHKTKQGAVKKSEAKREKIYGLHPGATADQLKAFEMWVDNAGFIWCNACGKRMQAHKGDVADHMNTHACVDSWSKGYRFYLIDAIARNYFPRAPGTLSQNAETEERLQNLLSASLASVGIHSNTAAKLFDRNSAFLRGLLAVGSIGLGVANTITKRKLQGVDILRHEVLKPIFVEGLRRRLPFSVGMDGSSTKSGLKGIGGEAELVFVYHALMPNPLIIAHEVEHGSPNATRLFQLLKRCVTGPDNMFMTEGQFHSHVKLLAADGASVMGSIASAGAMVKVGDPPHAVQLCIKAITKTMGLHPFLRLAKKVLSRRKCLPHRKLLAAFNLKDSLFSISIAKWSYIANVLRHCADFDFMARLTAWCDYQLAVGGYNASSVIQQAAAQSAAAEVDMDAACEAEGDFDGLDDDESDDEADEEDEDTVPVRGKGRAKAGTSAEAKAKARRLQLTKDLFDMLRSPDMNIRLQVTFLLIKDFRSIGVKLQTDQMSPDVLQALNGAFDTISLLKTAEGRAAQLEPARSVIDKAVEDPPAIVSANVVSRPDGEFLVSNLAEITSNTMRLKQFEGENDDSRKAAGQKLWVNIVTGAPSRRGVAAVTSFVEAAVDAVTDVYNKHVTPLWSSAERRHIASLMHFNKEYLAGFDFSELLAQKGALPDSNDDDYPWSWNSGAAAAGSGASAASSAAAAITDDTPPSLRPKLKQRLLQQWIAFKGKVLTVGSDAFCAPNTSPSDGALYWIRTRQYWPDLSELMLFWLTSPVSTCRLERGFSIQTLLDQDTRRRRRNDHTISADILTVIHREALEVLLSDSLTPPVASAAATVRK